VPRQEPSKPSKRVLTRDNTLSSKPTIELSATRLVMIVSPLAPLLTNSCRAGNCKTSCGEGFKPIGLKAFEPVRIVRLVSLSSFTMPCIETWAAPGPHDGGPGLDICADQ
jgi:hypothetical protein